MDDSFETVMEMRSRDFSGSWELFATYLKTHPANPEQEHASIDDFSWVMTIRLMRYDPLNSSSLYPLSCFTRNRNILCHEYNFRFECLKELSQQSVQFFGTKHAIESVFDLYRSLCCSSRKIGYYTLFPY